MNNSEHEEGRPIGSLYIWDDLEKRGFPVTEDVMVLPIDALTWEERQVLAAGDSEAISEMVKREGNTLEEFVMMGATTVPCRETAGEVPARSPHRLRAVAHNPGARRRRRSAASRAGTASRDTSRADGKPVRPW